MKNWIELCSDVNWEDYHGMWCRQAADGSWWVLKWTNMYDAMGEDECKSSHIKQYECEVKRLDLEDLDKKELNSALKSCGFTLVGGIEGGELIDDRGETIDNKYRYFAMVECCISYGLGAPMNTFTSDSYPLRLRAKARKYAENLMKDEKETKVRLSRSVNALGSTAEEYGRGDINSALMRGGYGSAPFDEEDFGD